MFNIFQKKETKPKGFWQGKEGTYGKFTLVALGIAAFLGVAAIGPWLLTVLTNAYAIGFVAVVTWAIGFTVTRPTFKAVVSTWFKGRMMLWAHGYVKRDFLQIMDVHIQTLEEKLIDIRFHGGELGRQHGRASNDVAEIQKELDLDMGRAIEAKKQMDTAPDQSTKEKWKLKLSEIANRIGDAKSSLQSLGAMAQRLGMMKQVVQKMQDVSEHVVRRLTNTVKMKKREYESLSTSHRALKGAHGMMYGKDEERNLFNSSMEHMTKMAGEKIGDIDIMMEDFKSIIVDQELDNAVFTQAGFKALEEWQAKHSDKLDVDLSFLDTPEATPVLANTAASNSGAQEATSGGYLR